MQDTDTRTHMQARFFFRRRPSLSGLTRSALFPASAIREREFPMEFPNPRSERKSAHISLCRPTMSLPGLAWSFLKGPVGSCWPGIDVVKSWLYGVDLLRSGSELRRSLERSVD